MNKKIFVLALVLATLVAVPSVFATGIGAQGGYSVVGGGGSGNGALTFKLDRSPYVFALDFAGSTNALWLGLTGDYWLANPKLEGTFGYFYGVGLGGSFYLGNDFMMTVGPRALVGLNFFLLNNFLEFYIQGAWQPYLYVSNNISFVPVNFPFNAGFRIWF